MEDIQNTAVEVNETAVEDDEDLFESSSWEDTSDIPADDKANEDEDLEVEKDEEEAEETTDEESDDNTDQSDSKDEHDQPDFLKIKFNKEEISLSRDQAAELAQKGMNYDRVFEGNQTMTPIYNEINRIAQANGMSVQDFMLNLSQLQSQFELNNEVAMLREQYPDADDSLLEEVARAHLNDKSAQLVNQKRQSDEARRREINRQLDVFEKRYKGVDYQNLDPEVVRLMREGYTLLEAWETVMPDKRAEQEKERASREKISKQNEENKKKSLGNLSSGGGNYGDEDDFVKELFSD